MKKSLILILTVITVLVAVSCDINELGSTMLSLNKNFFYPATADEAAVEGAIADLKKEGNAGACLNPGEPSTIVAFAEAAVEDILSFGENAATQKAYIAALEAEDVIPATATEDVSSFKSGLKINGTSFPDFIAASKAESGDAKDQFDSMQANIDGMVPGATDLLLGIAESLAGESKTSYTQKDMVVVGVINDVASLLFPETETEDPELEATMINTLIQDVKLIGMLMPEKIGDRITDLFSGFMDAMLNSDSE